jgi:hypothetical protein
MQVGTPTQTQPISQAATNSNGWVYGLFELAFVVALVLVITLPFWGKWMFRPFRSKHDDDD